MSRSIDYGNLMHRAMRGLIQEVLTDVQMNGLSIDRHSEERTIELFADNIMRAGRTFLDNPSETPFIATWNRVHAADPDFIRDMQAAALADSRDYSD